MSESNLPGEVRSRDQLGFTGGEQTMGLNATAVTGHTPVGVWGKPPYTRGNCFSVTADDGNEYRIVNFVYENLKALQKAGLTWPVAIRVLAGRTAVVHDRRIPHDWYQARFCEVCCPRSLLPLPQTLRHEREVMQGVRVEHENGCVTMQFGTEPECLVKPNVRGNRRGTAWRRKAQNEMEGLKPACRGASG